MFNSITELIIKQSSIVIRHTVKNIVSLPPFIPKYTQPPLRNRKNGMDNKLYFSNFASLERMCEHSLRLADY